MTKLGLYLTGKSINQSKVAQRSGLTKSRINQLMNEPSTKLRADELYVIALAIDVNPAEMLEAVCGHLKKGGKLK